MEKAADYEFSDTSQSPDGASYSKQDAYFQQDHEQIDTVEEGFYTPSYDVSVRTSERYFHGEWLNSIAGDWYGDIAQEVTTRRYRYAETPDQELEGWLHEQIKLELIESLPGQTPTYEAHPLTSWGGIYWHTDQTTVYLTGAGSYEFDFQYEPGSTTLGAPVETQKTGDGLKNPGGIDVGQTLVDVGHVFLSQNGYVRAAANALAGLRAVLLTGVFNGDLAIGPNGEKVLPETVSAPTPEKLIDHYAGLPGGVTLHEDEIAGVIARAGLGTEGENILFNHAVELWKRQNPGHGTLDLIYARSRLAGAIHELKLNPFDREKMAALGGGIQAGQEGALIALGGGKHGKPQRVPTPKTFRGQGAKHVDWDHIFERHSDFGGIAKQRGKADQVFRGLSKPQIKASVGEAWKNRKRMSTQTGPDGVSRIYYEGTDSKTGRRIGFWFNKSNSTIETAFPLH